MATAAVIQNLTDDLRREIVEKKVTCPFVGSAVAMQLLPVLNAPSNPLASIQDVTDLGNTGGGDLGNVLALFASGNQAFMRGPGGQLDQPAPKGLFSLEFPGSHGSHPGHSRILEENPHVLDSGRFSQSDFDRLASRATQGFVTRSAVGDFIAENLHRDPESNVHVIAVLAPLLRGLGHFLEDLRAPNAPSDTQRDLEEVLTTNAGRDNLVGSCGEFGLLFAFLAKKPGAREIGQPPEPALSLEDLHSMFAEKRLPDRWETWPKTRIDWLINSAELMIAAGRAYRAQSGRAQSGGTQSGGAQSVGAQNSP